MAGTMLYEIQVDDGAFARMWQDATGEEAKRLRKAAGTSLRRVRTGARAFISETVRDVYSVKARPLKDQLRLTRVSNQALSFNAYGTNKPISMIHFSVRGATLNQTKRGVSVAVMKKKRKVIRRAFIANDIRGNRRVFTRFTGSRELMPIRTMKAGMHSGKERRGIRVLMGPSAADMLFKVEIDEKLAPVVRDRFLIEFANNSKFFGLR